MSQIATRYPAARAHFKLLVNGTQTIALIFLELKESHSTTTTGRINPGAEPTGSPRSADHI
jgi:hypothetical protein